jgi:hypothetical protein
MNVVVLVSSKNGSKYTKVVIPDPSEASPITDTLETPAAGKFAGIGSVSTISVVPTLYEKGGKNPIP